MSRKSASPRRRLMPEAVGSSSGKVLDFPTALEAYRQVMREWDEPASDTDEAALCNRTASTGIALALTPAHGIADARELLQIVFRRMLDAGEIDADRLAAYIKGVPQDMQNIEAVTDLAMLVSAIRALGGTVEMPQPASIIATPDGRQVLIRELD